MQRAAHFRLRCCLALGDFAHDEVVQTWRRAQLAGAVIGPVHTDQGLLARALGQGRRHGAHQFGRYALAPNLIQRALISGIAGGRWRQQPMSSGDREALGLRAVEGRMEALAWVDGVGSVGALAARRPVARVAGTGVATAIVQMSQGHGPTKSCAAHGGSTRDAHASQGLVEVRRLAGKRA